MEETSKLEGETSKLETSKLEKATCVSWEESEAGWGVRPDGCSLHTSADKFNEFLNEYWNSMPDKAPNEYSRPAGKPMEVQVSSDLYKKIQESKNGLRLWEPQESLLVSKKEIVYGDQRSGWVKIK